MNAVYFAAGLLIVVSIVLSAIRTVVLPHGRPVRITRFVFRTSRRVVALYSKIDRSPSRRHAAMQMSVAVALLCLPLLWLTCAVGGYTLMFRGLGTSTWRASYDFAGSSMFTLGSSHPDDLPRITLGFSGAALAISVLALLLVTYLPTIYQAYTNRESFLTAFETIAGDPPNVEAMFIRANDLDALGRLAMVWEGWTLWFAELRESHTALPAVPFLGASRADRNWVATVGTLLDAAAVSLAVVDYRTDGDTDAALCLRAGSLALRDIAEYFDIEVDHDPRPDDPISVSRSGFDDVYDRLEAAGVPVTDREDAWRNWAGWRVNYDAALVGLAVLTASPTTRLVAGVYRRPD